MENVIISTPEVEAVAAGIRGAGAFAIDLEFVPEGYYVPALALVQVAWGNPDEPESRLIDPLAVDARPVLELIADPSIETILHAGQADLALLAGHYDLTALNLRDTQIAASFLGYGDQVGFAPLLEQVLRVRLSKQGQYSEWLRRPLTPQQVTYALDDVRYLPRLWAVLRERLEAEGRLGWVEDECARLARIADTRPDPAEAYRRIKGWSRLRTRQRGALRGLAAWREQEARRTNQPPNRLVPERSMQELAQSVPSDAAGLLSVRGVTEGIVRRYGEAMLAALADGAANPPPTDPRDTPPDPRAEGWTTILQGLARSRAQEAGVAVRFLAPREELEALAAWRLAGESATPPALAVLNGWRRTLAGDALLSWLDGRTGVVADPALSSGLRLAVVAPDVTDSSHP